MTPPFYGLTQSSQTKPEQHVCCKHSNKQQQHRQHIHRHFVVDFLISAGGSLFAIAAIQKLVWAGIFAIICLFGGLLFDYWNIEDEEHEIEEAVHEGERSVKTN